MVAQCVEKGRFGCTIHLCERPTRGRGACDTGLVGVIYVVVFSASLASVIDDQPNTRGKTYHSNISTS
jgi:hypothetical protein